MLNKQVYFDQVIIKHEHPDWGFGQRDEIYHKNGRDWKHDVSVYNSRKLKKFDL